MTVPRLVAQTSAAALLCSGVGAAAEGNLVRNADFEEVADGSAAPAGWSFAWQYTHSDDRSRGRQKQEPDYGVDTEVVKSGSRSFRIGVRRPGDDGVLTQDGVPARQGAKVYAVRAWVRTRDMKDTSANLAVVFLDEADKWLGANYAAIAVGDSQDWRSMAGFVAAPPRTARLRIRLWMNFNYTGTGTAWFDAVEVVPTDLEEMPPIRYIDENPMPELDDHWRGLGFVVFRRSYLETVFPNSKPRPGEVGGGLTLAACPGEAEPISFCVRALRNLERLVVQFSDLTDPAGRRIPASAITAGLVRCLYRRGQARWGPYADGRMLKPTYVEPGRPFGLAADTTKQVWATVRVPDDVPAGVYSGSAAVGAGDADPHHVPLRLTVRSFRLQEPPGVTFGMYSIFHAEPGRLDAIYADMRDHGMTSVGFCGPLGAPITREAGRVDVALGGEGVLEGAVAAYRQAGFPEPFVWLMGSDVHRWCLQQGELESDAFSDSYRQVVLRILEHGRRNDWPEIIFQPVDEPFEHTKGLPLAKRCLQVLKSVPGVRTEEDGPNGNPSLLEELYPWCDVIVMHDGPVMKRRHYDADAWQSFLARTRRDGKQVWFYNIDLTGCHPEVMRWGYGFGLWFSGATGMIEWSYQTALRAGKPERVYSRENTIVYQYPAWEEEPGGPAIGWEAIREGVDDYKYVWALDRAIRDVTRSGDTRQRETAKRAAVYLEGLRRKTDFRAHEGSACQGDWTGVKRVLPTGEKGVGGSYKMANGWSFAGYGEARERIAAFLLALGGRE